MNGFNERIASWGASAAARIFFARVCFAAHSPVANFHDETNPWAHKQRREDCQIDNHENATVMESEKERKGILVSVNHLDSPCEPREESFFRHQSYYQLLTWIRPQHYCSRKWSTK